MITAEAAFSGFSVNDLEAAKKFYSQYLGLSVEENPQGLQLKVGAGEGVFVYPKPDHQPATYTILNFVVSDVDQTVDELVAKGIIFEHYDGLTDEKGIAHGVAAQRGPDIAWFKDPAGNILSVMHNG